MRVSLSCNLLTTSCVPNNHANSTAAMPPGGGGAEAYLLVLPCSA
jgi:hypothetical protein